MDESADIAALRDELGKHFLEWARFVSKPGIIIDLPGYPPQLPEFADMDEPDDGFFEVSDG